jgi:DNA (cytosine-5)-methyltransferase 1
MKMVELFSGCGGLAKGLEQAGFTHEALVEFNHQACESLRLNFDPSIVHEADVRSFDFLPYVGVDAIAGGPPCQPFSLGGLAKANEDNRDMFPQAIRAISELHPRGFIFENVKGLLRKSFSDYFNYIILRLTYPSLAKKEDEQWRDHLSRLQKQIFPLYKGLKYQVQYKLLNAADYGVPQVRERVFIVGLREDVAAQWSWPTPEVSRSEWRTIQSALQDLPDPQSPDNSIPDHQFIGGARIYPGHTGSNYLEPSKTIKAGAHGVPGGENMIRFPDGTVRYLTIQEAKRIQTFPPDYAITGPWGEAMRQIGNAVPVKLAECVGRKLFEVLSSTQQAPFLYRTDESGNMMLFEETTKYRTRQRKGRSKQCKSI